MMDYDVTVDRDKYIGGSDVPVLMGISSFRTRWSLLLEKAGLESGSFSGNVYTMYGDEMEPKIRAYINETNVYAKKKPFEPSKLTVDDLRAHTDGFNGECILEIKTTSHVCEELAEYEVYLVQILFYMMLNHVDLGVLAVYERPEDMDTELDAGRLHVYEVYSWEHLELIRRIQAEIERFRMDLERLKKNPLLTEQDFQPTELVVLSCKVMELEQKLADMKKVEKSLAKMKQNLFDAMERHGVKSWETYNGTKITRVDGLEPQEQSVKVFDEESFREEHGKLYQRYLKDKVKKAAGRKGYVKISLPRVGEDSARAELEAEAGMSGGV